MAVTSEQWQRYSESKNFGYSARLTYSVTTDHIYITKIEMCQDSTSHSYNAYYGNSQTATLNIGGTSHSITKSGIALNNTNWYIAWEGSLTNDGSLGDSAVVTWQCRGRSTAPYTLTFSWTIQLGRVSINPQPDGRTKINLNRYWNTEATYCKYNINDWGWIDEWHSYDNGVYVAENEVSNLTPNTTYKCQILFGDGITDIYSNIAYATTGGNNPVVKIGDVIPNRLSCTFDNFTATLDEPLDRNKIKSRKIDYRVAGTTTWFTTDPILEPAEPEPITINGLIPNTPYQYKYYITDIFDHTGDSGIQSFTTIYRKPTIEPIGNEEGNSKITPITSSTTNGGGFTCIIEAKGDAKEEGETDYVPISKYYLYYRKNGTSTDYIVYPQNGSNSKNITITGLETDTEYECYLAVENTEGDTAETPTVIKVTNRIPPVIESVNSIIDGITIELTAFARVDSTEGIYYSFKLDNEHEWTEPQLPNTYLWTGLAELTTYPIKIKVIAKSSSQYGQDVESAVWTENVKTDVDQAKVRIKTSGNWIEGKLFIKKDNQWVKAKRVYIKKNNQWVIGKNQ